MTYRVVRRQWTQDPNDPSRFTMPQIDVEAESPEEMWSKVETTYPGQGVFCWWPVYKE